MDPSGASATGDRASRPTAPRGWFADVLLGRAPRDVRAAATVLVDDGVAPRAIYLDVLAPALQEVGSRWERGMATVAQEHLATALVSSIMAGMAPLLGAETRIHREVVLACTDDEMHAVGLRMVADFLEADGWDVTYLGAVTPGAELERLVRDHDPWAVCLSTTLTTHLHAAAAVVASLRRLPRPPFILVGGGAYLRDPDAQRRVGADAFAADAGAASAILRERLGRG